MPSLDDNTPSVPLFTNSVYLLAKQKWIAEGRPFGDEETPMCYSVVLLSPNGRLPLSYFQVIGLEKCNFAPGSILLDSAHSAKYIFDGSEWVEWEN